MGDDAHSVKPRYIIFESDEELPNPVDNHPRARDHAWEAYLHSTVTGGWWVNDLSGWAPVIDEYVPKEHRLKAMLMK